MILIEFFANSNQKRFTEKKLQKLKQKTTSALLLSIWLQRSANVSNL